MSDVTFTFTNEGIISSVESKSLDLSGEAPKSGTMIVNKNGEIAIAVSDGKYCFKKGYNDSEVTMDEDLDNCTILYEDSTLNGAIPELKTGMVPVTIEPNGIVTKADLTSKWYDYSTTKKEWANAILVKKNSNGASANVGDTIDEEDILAYFVWIPRYKYKLWYTETVDGSTAIDTSVVHEIEVVFENKTKDKSEGTENGEYLTHPAFTFGSVELNGIWVGKFETGYEGANSKTDAEVGTGDSSKVIIKPTTSEKNIYSWRSINVSNAYETVKGMNKIDRFGLNETDSDTHMMKNIEWGAVAYLTHSIYGRGTDEVYINNNSKYMTGCGGDLASASQNATCQNKYGADSLENGKYNQSTTENIYGIFDMSGGAYEYVMGHILNNYGPSGFDSTTFEEKVEAKYVDEYSSSGSTSYTNRKLGDATGEMGPFASNRGSWFEDYAYFVESSYPWFLRSGSNYNGTYAGLFHINVYTGNADNVSSFRIVLV